MGQVELCDCLVQHQALDQDRDQIIIDKVAWKRKVYKRGCGTETVLEVLSIRHLHSKERSLIGHTNVLGSIGQRKVGQIGEMLEHVGDLESLQLSDL